MPSAVLYSAAQHGRRKHAGIDPAPRRLTADASAPPYREVAREYANERLRPRVLEAYRNESALSGWWRRPQLTSVITGRL